MRTRPPKKLLPNHPYKLIVDSSYIDCDGKENKQYTNTILVTEDLPWWQEKIIEQFCDVYTQHNKGLSSGHQIVFKDGDGNKHLTFSLYPSKNKLMVQGSHKDLCKWIDSFRTLSAGGSTETVCTGASHDSNTVTDIQQSISKIGSDDPLPNVQQKQAGEDASLATQL
jgi:hypothetical protein